MATPQFPDMYLTPPPPNYPHLTTFNNRDDLHYDMGYFHK